MSAARGVILGTLALTAGHALLTGAARPGGGPVASTFVVATRVMRRLMDPTVPLIPDLRDPGATAPAAATKPASYRTPALPAAAAPQGGSPYQSA